MAVYPARIGRQSAPVELSPSAALRLAESADRAALAAQTAPSRTELLRRRTRRPHPTELDPSWSLPATVTAAVQPVARPGRSLLARLLRRRKDR